MENETKERSNRRLNLVYNDDKELLDTTMKLFEIIRDFVDLCNDKYPGLTSEEVATIGMQLFMDACHFQEMTKEETVRLANVILKQM